MSLYSFNYPLFTNYFISIMSGFSFFSMLIKLLLYYLQYTIKSNFIFNLLNIFISCFFEYLHRNANDIKLLNLTKKELFKVNKIDIRNKNIYEVFLYILDIIRNVKYNNNYNTPFINLLNTIIVHKNNCSLINCKCKLLQIIPHGEQYDKNYILNLIERIGFLIETSFVQIDLYHNYNLTIILSEHFYLIKENPIMAYSLIQTLLSFNFDNLSISNYLVLYETCQKYIETSLDYNYLSKKMMRNTTYKVAIELQTQLSHDMLKENSFRSIFLVYNKISQLQSLMNDYIQIAIDFIKNKILIEESTKIERNEDTGEVIWINFIYLDSKNIDNIIKSLKKETILNNDLYEHILELKATKLPIEFYYKMFIFCETFWEGKINEQILPILYSFTNDRNLYSNTINPNIFILLRQRFIDFNNQGLSKHYNIFKFGKGLIISYYSEPLSHYLGFLQSELIGNNIDILLPNDIRKCHHNLLLHYLIIKQNKIYKTINNRMFNKEGLSIESIMNGASLPGLGKNLLIIVNIKIIENDTDYFLYYNQYLDLISISNNFSKYFNLDMHLLNKYNVNLLSIFDINLEILKKKLIEFMPIINEYKYNLDIMNEEIFAKKLFKQINKFNSNKLKILEEMERHNLDENKNNFENKLLKAQKYLEKIYNHKFIDNIKSPTLVFKKNKSSIFNNIYKYVNNNDTIYNNEKSYKKLIDSFSMFLNCHNQNKYLNTINLSKFFYKFYIKFEILYDISFILIKFNEVKDFSIITENETIISDQINIFVEYNENYNKLFVNNSLKGEQNNRMYTNETRNKSSSATLTITKFLNFQYIIKLNLNLFEKNIKIIIFFFICYVLCVYIVILIYQLNVVENCYNIFLAFYSNYIQRDRLVNLHSSIFSGYYYYMNLIDYSDYIPINQYQEYIINSAHKFSRSFHTFYENYIKYRFFLGQDLSSIYESFNISKISVNWDENTIISNYMNEVEYIVHMSKISSFNDKLDEIIIDINNFFKSRYKYLEGNDRKLKSGFISILYYFSANMQNSFAVFFRKIQKEINNAHEKFSSSSMSLCIIIEILGFLANFIMLSSCILFLKKSNESLYKNISNLFIDFTQEGEYNFKNNNDNFIIIDKLKKLKYLINNFSVKAIDKYNKKLLYSSIDIIEDNKHDISFKSIKNKSSNKDIKFINEKDNKINQNMNNINEISNNNTNYKEITNSSILNSKTQGQLLKTNTINIISKLNQKIYNNDKSIININSTKNSYIQNSSIKNISVNNKNEEEDNYILYADKISVKLKTIYINSIKLFILIIFIFILFLLIYAIIKIIITLNYLKRTKQMFIDYSIVTFEYSMIINYFNNLNLILVNKKLGREDVLNKMQNEVETQFKKSEEVKKKSIAQYPNVYKMFSNLNNVENEEKLKNKLCKTDNYCLKIFDSKYNIVKNGVDVGLKAAAQVIYNSYKDYLQIKDKIDDIEKVRKYFISDNYKQIDMSLNFLFIFVEDRCAEAFIIDCKDLIKSFNIFTISFNIFIIGFLFIFSILLIIFIIDKIIQLNDIVEKSSARLCTTFCLIKEKNTEYKMKTNRIL